jgi:hypothetical protein
LKKKKWKLKKERKLIKTTYYNASVWKLNIIFHQKITSI